MTTMRLLASTLAVATALPALAQDEPSPAERAHQLRAGLMYNYAFNLGPLGAMAKGEVPFDAAVAAMHAGNIAGIARVDLSPYWVEGSSNTDLEDSRALPAIWENLDDVETHRVRLLEAAQALEAATGEGQEAFASAFRGVGQACGACHEDYREPDEE